MIIKLEKELLFSTFNVDSFEMIESKTQTMAPSMVEYYLSDLASNSQDAEIYLNKTEIEYKIDFDEYLLYADYSNNVYLEFIPKENDYEETLW